MVLYWEPLTRLDLLCLQHSSSYYPFQHTDQVSQMWSLTLRPRLFNPIKRPWTNEFTTVLRSLKCLSFSKAA